MICRLSLVLLCSTFSAVKMGVPFSLRCLTPLSFHAVDDWHTQKAPVGMLCFGLDGLATQKGQESHGYAGHGVHAQKMQVGMMCCTTDGFVAGMKRRLFHCNTEFSPTKKSSLFFQTSWTVKASHEARRRMAAFPIQLSGIHTRPASREACCRAAVTPQPSRMSPYAPARIARSPGCRGTAPASPADRFPDAPCFRRRCRRSRPERKRIPAAARARWCGNGS